MAVCIKRISLSNDTHIDNAVDAKHQSANGEQNTNYAQQGRIRCVWPRSTRYQGTTYNQILLNLGIISPGSMLTPLLYRCSVNHISSVSISTFMFIFHRLSLFDGLSSVDVLKG